MQNKNKKRKTSASRREHHRLIKEETTKLANLFTWGNLLCGLASILLSIKGKFTLAIAFVGVALICDFLDGRIARRAKKSTTFGMEFDSLADLVSFGLAPIVYGYMHVDTWFALIAYGANLSAGAMRLARYNVLSHLPHFIGIPIPVNAAVIFGAILLGLPQQYWPYLYILMAVLMISPHEQKKL